MSLFAKRNKTVIPLELEPVPQWDDADARGMKAFLQSTCGRKLMSILYHDLYSRALNPRLKTEHEQGIDHGKNMMLAMIQSMGIDASADEADTE